MLLLLVAAAGTTALVRYAPGFLSNERELDAKYAQGARFELQGQDRSFASIFLEEFAGWTRGDLGTSRQYQIPVTELVSPRMKVSARLLTCGILCGWLISFCAALPVSGMRRGGYLWRLPFTVLLATPTAAMATACILSDSGGPILVLTLLIAARDFKFLARVLSEAWNSPNVLQGRAQGLGPVALVRLHILPSVVDRLSALATLSIVTAMAALIPIEVIFNVPGIGQLAWNAVMNRDMPVLVAVTAIMATGVALASMFSNSNHTLEAA
jgi:peptide/nickel transport system permease protein